jgi:hypothetical protein
MASLGDKLRKMRYAFCAIYYLSQTFLFFESSLLN